MKKIFATMLALIAVLALCSCGKSQEKKVQNLLDNGDYEAARDAIQEMENQENSAAMLAECDYLQATDHLNAGDYAAAREMFIALGDYKNSKDLAASAAKGLLIAYIQPQGELSNHTGDTTIRVEEGKLQSIYLYQTAGMLSLDVTVTITFAPDSNTAVISGTDKSSSHFASYEAGASTTWDFSTYVSGNNVTWTDFQVSGTTAQGTPYTQDLTILNHLATTAAKSVTAYLAQVLADSDLGLSMADLGFGAY